MRYVLASASPRRKELLRQILPDFEVLPAQGKEASNATEEEEYVKTLASHKAEEVFASLDGDVTVIGADTVVLFKHKILGKPKDKEDAKRTLSALSGNTHFVLTGVCVLKREGNKTVKRVEAERSEVLFKTLRPEQIESYVKSGAPLDKAGSYGIQDSGFVERTVGSYSNIVGLPVGLLRKMLREL